MRFLKPGFRFCVKFAPFCNILTKRKVQMEFSWNPNTKSREKPQYSIPTHTFFDVSSFSKIPKPTDQKQQIGKKCILPPFSLKISLRDTSFHISLNSLEFYLSRILVEFSLTCIYIHTSRDKCFQFMVFAFLENTLNLCIFTHASVPHSKLQVELFENLFLPKKNQKEC